MRLPKTSGYNLFISENYATISARVKAAFTMATSSIIPSTTSRARQNQEFMRRTHAELGRLWQLLSTDQRNYYRNRALESAIQKADRIADALSDNARHFGSPFSYYIRENFRSMAVSHGPKVHPSEIFRKLVEVWRKNREQLLPEYSIKLHARHSPNGDLTSTAKAMTICQPKRPANPFLLFRSEVTKELSQSAYSRGPGNIALVSSTAAKRWSQLSDSQKQPYINRFKEQQSQYERDKEEYKNNRSLEDLLTDGRLRSKQKMRKLGLLSSTPGPRTAFHFYQQEVFPVVCRELHGRPLSEMNKVIGERWRMLDSSSKQRYIELCWEDRRRQN